MGVEQENLHSCSFCYLQIGVVHILSVDDAEVGLMEFSVCPEVAAHLPL